MEADAVVPVRHPAQAQLPRHRWVMLLAGLMLLSIAALQFQLWSAVNKRGQLLEKRCVERNHDTAAILDFVTGRAMDGEDVIQLRKELEPTDCSVYR